MRLSNAELVAVWAMVGYIFGAIIEWHEREYYVTRGIVPVLSAAMGFLVGCVQMHCLEAFNNDAPEAAVPEAQDSDDEEKVPVNEMQNRFFAASLPFSVRLKKN